MGCVLTPPGTVIAGNCVCNGLTSVRDSPLLKPPGQVEQIGGPIGPSKSTENDDEKHSAGAQLDLLTPGAPLQRYMCLPRHRYLPPISARAGDPCRAAAAQALARRSGAHWSQCPPDVRERAEYMQPPAGPGSPGRVYRRSVVTSRGFGSFSRAFALAWYRRCVR
jgi:hypothetical protein